MVAPGAIKLATDPSLAFADADIILVTVKSGATAAMAGLIAEHAPSGVTVVSLQNGVGNVDLLLARLGGIGRIVAGMVPFNVVQSHGSGEARFHRATSGTMLIGAGVPGLRAALNVQGADVIEHADMAGVLWGKLMLNLNNALNALSGVPLATQLADRRWRLILARQIAEALGVLKAAGIKPARIEGVSPGMIPRILRLPNWLFRRVAAAHAGDRPGGALLDVGGPSSPPADRDRLSARRDPGAGAEASRSRPAHRAHHRLGAAGRGSRRGIARIDT